jgi:hypothetical protein
VRPLTLANRMREAGNRAPRIGDCVQCHRALNLSRRTSEPDLDLAVCKSGIEPRWRRDPALTKQAPQMRALLSGGSTPSLSCRPRHLLVGRYLAYPPSRQRGGGHCRDAALAGLITPSRADLSRYWSSSPVPSSPEPYQASHRLTASRPREKSRLAGPAKAVPRARTSSRRLARTDRGSAAVRQRPGGRARAGDRRRRW